MDLQCIMLSVNISPKPNPGWRNRKMKSFKFGLKTACATLVMSLIAAGSAFAGTASGTLAVSATVNTNCTVNSPTLTFTAIDPTAGVNSTGSATLSVTCTKSTTLVDIKLGPG